MATDRFPAGTPLRVAMTGPAGAGKTTHARKLQEKFRGDVLSFATPLKKICREIFGDQMDSPEFSRSTLQAVGVALRAIDREVWVKLLLSKVSPDRPVFVDDCRFYNEYQALQKRGFVFVRCGASMTTLNERRPGMTDSQRLHESEVESAIIPGDFTLFTEGDVDEVSQAAVELIENLRPELMKRPVKTAAK